MASIFDIPEFCLAEILSHWIVLVDITNLDSAFCTIVERNGLLTVFKHAAFVVQEILNLKCTKQLRYICIRLIKVKRISFQQYHEIQNFHTMVQGSDSVELLSLPFYDNSIIPFINSCTALQTFLVYGNAPSESGSYILDIDPMRLNNLTDFRGQGNNVSESSINHLANNCANIARLNIIYENLVVPCDAITKLLRMQGSALREIRIAAEKAERADTITTCLAQHCPMLQFVYLDAFMDITLPHIIKLLKQCPQWTYLSATGHHHVLDFSMDRQQPRSVATLSLALTLAYIPAHESHIETLLTLVPDCVCIDLSVDLTPRLFRAISNNLLNLREFTSWYGSPKITTSDITHLLLVCTHLQNLTILGTSGNIKTINCWLSRYSRNETKVTIFSCMQTNQTTLSKTD